jgi:hypothetical protein
MRYKISPKQFTLLTHFTITEQGVTSFNLIKESRLKVYLVRFFMNGMLAELEIGAYSSASALFIVRKLFPKATLTGSAIPIK